jgi:hypothetical protein
MGGPDQKEELACQLDNHHKIYKSPIIKGIGLFALVKGQWDHVTLSLSSWKISIYTLSFPDEISPFSATIAP